VIFRITRCPFALLAVVLPLAQGCCGTPRPNLNRIRTAWTGDSDLTPPYFDVDVAAVCDPPIGWKPSPLKINANHVHQVWVSPSGATAYGVIYLKLPLPVGQNLALGGFLDHMKSTEGAAKLLSRQDDPNLPGIRFVAEGKVHTIRVNFIVNGWEGWAVYAGTNTGKKVDQDELDIALRARTNTVVGWPETTGN
jgi:hypothetical protein